MGSRTILYLTLFLAIAGVAGIFARAYFSDQSAEAAIEPESTGPKIIVAARKLDVGAFLTPDDVRWQATKSGEEIVISQHFVEGAATLESMLGAVVRRRIDPDQPVTAAQIIKPGQRGFLAAVLRPGMRAVTVEIDKVSGNSGLVFPGDHIDLILTVDLDQQRSAKRTSRSLSSETILSNIRVIAIGQRVETFASVEAAPDDRPPTTATLEVAPQHAERINVAQEIGRLALSLRSLADERVTEQEQIVGGYVPNADDAKAQMTWAADVSSAVRARELSMRPVPMVEVKPGEPPPPPPPLIIMRGGERNSMDEQPGVTYQQ